MLPERKKLPHAIPAWANDGAIYFITICASPRGQNQLARLETASLIYDSFLFREQRGDWWAHLLLLMPDHLHALMSFAPEPGMQHAIAQWKHYIAHKMGFQWQRDFFDHRLRNSENHREKAHYIRMNPVRAGLVAKPEEWPFVWSKTW